MAEVDLFIDYSTINSEFSILGKPQLSIPDYENSRIKGFAENYKSLMPGKEINDFDELKKYILNYLDCSLNYEKNLENYVTNMNTT